MKRYFLTGCMLLSFSCIDVSYAVECGESDYTYCVHVTTNLSSKPGSLPGYLVKVYINNNSLPSMNLCYTNGETDAMDSDDLNLIWNRKNNPFHTGSNTISYRICKDANCTTSVDDKTHDYTFILTAIPAGKKHYTYTAAPKTATVRLTSGVVCKGAQTSSNITLSDFIKEGVVKGWNSK